MITIMPVRHEYLAVPFVHEGNRWKRVKADNPPVPMLFSSVTGYLFEILFQGLNRGRLLFTKKPSSRIILAISTQSGY
jgi:hypothetical protein